MNFSWSFILVLGWQLLLLLALVAGRRTLALVAMIGGLIAIGLDAVQLLRADLPGNWIVVATLPYAAILTFAGLGLRNGRHHSIGWLALPIVSFFVAEPFLVVAGLIAIGLTGLVLFGVDPRWTAAAAVLAGTVAIHVGLIVAASGADIATRQKALAIGSAIGLALFLGILATVGRRRLLRT